jgi:sulfide:quinone oxidoreductase
LPPNGRGKLIMAEFNYAKEPVETFPVDQRAERFSMYALKAYMLPRLYWHGMLRGRASLIGVRRCLRQRSFPAC